MKICSKEFGNGGALPKTYSCDGENVNPPLTIEDVPREAKSLAIIIDDMSVPAGRINHWCLWNINPKTISISKGSKPFGAVVGTNSLEKPYYLGPCPPENDDQHEYHVKLFALNGELPLSAKANVNELESAIIPKLIDQSEMIFYYRRISPEIKNARDLKRYPD